MTEALGSDPFLQGLLEPCTPIAASGLTSFLALCACALQTYSHTDGVQLFQSSSLLQWPQTPSLSPSARTLATRPGEGRATSVEAGRDLLLRCLLWLTHQVPVLQGREIGGSLVFPGHLMFALLLYTPKMLAWERVLGCPSHGLIQLHPLSPVQTLGSCASTFSCC